MVDIISLLVALSATAAAGIGIFVLGHFFHDQLKNLFDDANYFVFFFLIAGYVLYAVGELTYYLMNVNFPGKDLIGVQDVYWFGGGILILVSFMGLNLYLSRNNNHHYFLTSLLIALSLAVLSYLLVARADSFFFDIVYPVISSLIIGFSSIVFFAANDLGFMARPLQILFFASLAILLGDIFFSFELKGENVKLISDAFYLVGYGVSALAFVFFRKNMLYYAKRNDKN